MTNAQVALLVDCLMASSGYFALDLPRRERMLKWLEEKDEAQRQKGAG